MRFCDLCPPEKSLGMEPKQLFKYQHLLLLRNICGLYYKHVMLVNDASSGIIKWIFKLIDAARGVIYDHHVFIIQATGGQS